MPAEPSVRAFTRAGLAGRVAPFAVTGALALLTALLDVPAERQTWLIGAAVLAGVTLLFGTLAPWERLPGWLEVVPPGLYIAAVAMLRHAAGGGSSGYSALYLVPVLWLALYGSRAQMLLATGLITVALVAPIVLEGAPAYPSGEWRRVLILVGVGATLGLIVQRLVREVGAGAARTEVVNRAMSAQQNVTEAIISAASDAVVSFEWSGAIVSADREAAVMFGRTDLVGQDVFDVLVPEEQRERLRAGLGRILTEERPADRDARFEAELLRADGSRVPVEIAVARTDGSDGLRLHAFVRDTTIRRAAEDAAREHLEDLDRLLAVGRELGRSGVDVRAAICAAARDLAGADFALLYTLDDDGRRLIVTGSAGRTAASTDIVLDPERSITGSVLRSGEAVFIGDLEGDQRADRSMIRRVGAAAAFLQPVAVDDRPIGVLVAYWHETVDALPERVVTLFGLFATQAAAAVERSDLLARLEALATTDALTGAANRRAMDDALAVAVADARRSGRPLSVIMLDLDHFKRYNDRHGHQAGDDLLRAAVAAWRTTVRPPDTLARFGGEEFLIVLPGTDLAAAVAVADRLRATLPSGSSASAGAASWDGAESVDVLVARADTALYRAKDEGRARTVASTPGAPDA